MTEKLEEIYNSCKDCTACQLCKSRTNVVFGCGDANADVMFIGEAPGRNEDETGIPFVGAAGKLLDTLLDAVDISRNSVYIANIVKCRPPQNRDPLPEEEDACIDYLHRQIDAIDPKVIVCLGRISAKRIIKQDFSITAERGKWFTYRGKDVIAVYHPAALIYDRTKKAVTFLDFKEIKRKIDEIEKAPV